MIEMTEETWRLFIVLGIGGLVLLVAMFVYCVRCARAAYLGEKWWQAAGTHRRAIQALHAFEHETEALVVQHAYRFPAGLLVSIDRENVERLIEQADRREAMRDNGGGGPGI